MNSIARNTLANYLGQGYTTIVGIVMLPVYLKYLGAEAYGLVGFFTMLQAWFTLMDMGLTPALSRQVAHVRGQAQPDWGAVRGLLRSIEMLFAALALCAFGAMVLSSPWISGQWLKVQSLSHTDVTWCIVLMGAMLGLRVFASLYRGGLQGLEQMVWLNGANTLIATLRFVGVVALLHWVTQDVRHFFHFQLAVGVLEVAWLGWHFYRVLPAPAVRVQASWQTLRPVVPFAGGLAYTTALWILLTQADKLILSNVLSLREYGYFALVAVVANGLFNLTGPISQAILPRMTVLVSGQNKHAAMQIYHRGTQWVSAVMFPVIGFIAVFAEEAIFIWTGDREAALWVAPVMPWFLTGNALVCVGAFAYYLQYARGNIELHVISSTVNAAVQVPVVVYVAYHWGVLAVAQAWVALRVLSFLVVPAITHRRFAPGYHKLWLAKAILPFVPLTVLALWLAQTWVLPMHRTGMFLTQIGFFVLLVLAAHMLLVKSQLLDISAP